MALFSKSLLMVMALILGVAFAGEVAAASVIGNQYSITTIGGVDWYYTVKDDGSVEIGTGSSSRTAVEQSYSGALTIPAVINGRVVKIIGKYAFYNCRGLTSVTIPRSVTSIEDSAFGCCSGLMTFLVDATNPSYSSMNEVLCSKDGKNLVAGVNGNVVIPSGVTNIGHGAFCNYSGLTSVMIPGTVTSVASDAFSGCSGLTSVTMPGWFKMSSVFPDSYEKINSLTIVEGTTEIGSSAFYGCRGLTSVAIPGGVTSIGYSAFYGCGGLTSMELPSSVQTIGRLAFMNCTSLKSIVMPTNLVSIGGSSFYNCLNLTSMTIPSSVTEIGGGAFYNCSKLSSVTIPSGVTEIGGGAFSGCSGLTNVTICTGVTNIADSAFAGCSRLFSIDVPASVANIGVDVFWGCSSITNVVLPFVGSRRGNSGTRDSLFGYVFGASSYEGGRETKQYYSGNSCTIWYVPESLKTVTITDETAIGYGAFYNCSGLTSVTIPSSVTSIGSSAFSGCSGLTSMTLPFVGSQRGNSGSEESLFGYVFGSNSFTGGRERLQKYSATAYSINCIPESLKTVTISDETAVGYGAFYNCDMLTSVTIQPSVTSIGSSAFAGCGGLTSMTLPFVGSQRGNSGCKESLFGYVFGSNPFAGGRETLQLYSLGSGSTWYVPESLKTVTITDEDAIGYGAFYGCSNLTSLVMCEGVTQIGESAFYGCSGLASIEICEGVAHIGVRAFSMCRELMSVSLPASIKVIGDLAFENCTALNCVNITDLKSWCAVSFLDYAPPAIANPLCYGERLKVNGEEIVDLVIPDGVVNIAAFAFNNCTEVRTLTVPSSVASIGSYAFYGCSSLKVVYTDPDDADRVGRMLTASGFNISGIDFLPRPSVSPIFYTNLQGALHENPNSYCEGSSFIFSPPGGRAGYTFTGWAPSAITADMTGAQTVTAGWRANAYQIVYDANGGSGTMAATDCEYDKEEEVATNGFTRSGYVFKGWAMEMNGEVVYKPGAKVMNLTAIADGTVRFYAVWEVEGLVSNVKVFSGYPWKEVMIGYKIAEGVDPLVDHLEVTVTNKMNGEVYECKTMEGVDLTPGNHVIKWNASVDGAKFKSDDVIFAMRIVRQDDSLHIAPYCVINLSGGASAASYPVTELEEFPSGGWKNEHKSTKLVLRLIEAGSYKMQNQFDVTLTKPFYMGVFEVTQKQYELVMGSNPSSYKGDYRPVEMISYDMIRGKSLGAQWPSDGAVDETSFLGKLRAKTGLDFDLPTEAQWEYACRAGTTCDYTRGSTVDDLKEIGRYYSNISDGKGGYSDAHTKVGSYLPDWGLYDMHGNVWEWCLDWARSIGNATDPKGGISGSTRVIRGGGWNSRANYCTSSSWVGSGPSMCSNDLGFRLSRTLQKDCGTVIAEVASAHVAVDTVFEDGINTKGAIPVAYGSVWNSGCDITANGVKIVESVADGVKEWLPQTEGEYKLIYSSGGVTMESKLVVTEANRPIIYVNLNGATHMNPEAYQEGTSVAFTPPSDRTGYTFAGWTPAAITEDMTGPQTVTANWRANTYRIIYDANGGSGTMAATDCEYDKEIIIATNGFTRASYIFTGWATNENGGVVYMPGEKAINLTAGDDGIVRFYAKWEYGVYSVDFVIDEYARQTGGGALKQMVEFGDVANAPIIDPGPGRTFVGWDGDVLSPITSNSLFHAQIEYAGTSGRAGTLDWVFMESTGELCFYGYGPIVDRACRLLSLAVGSIKSIVIMEGVTSIGSSAFSDCSGLESVTIPSSVTSVGDYAFSRCSGLTSVTISEGVTNIGAEAFFNCSGLTSVTIPSSVTSIGSYAFYYCSGLTSVTILEGVMSIGDDAFSGCSGLMSVTIPSSVTSVGECAFRYCSGLEAVTIISSVTSIGSRAFHGCDGLADADGFIIIRDVLLNYCGGAASVAIPSSVTSIGSYAFYNCNGLTSVEIPLSVTNVGDHAFYNCSGLMSVTIPSSVTSIGSYAFYNCNGLTSVEIPLSVMNVGDHAFYNCSGLTSVTIPSSVTSIGDCAFGCCIGLMSFLVDAANPNYSSMNEMLCSKDGKNLIAGVNGDVTIPLCVTNIGNSAFCGCSGLISVTIPLGVTSIGDDAFYGCSGLTSVTIPLGVTSLGSYAFYRCRGLTSVTIPSSVMSIGDDAFSGCSGLTSVTIPSSVMSIGDDAFSGCSGLMSVTIPSSVTRLSSAFPDAYTKIRDVTICEGVMSVGDDAFYDCSGLMSVTIPSSVTSIGRCAFYKCGRLSSVTIPPSVTSIGSSAFYGCSGMTSVAIPLGVTSIGSYAFSDCSGLTSVMIPSTVTSIGSCAFYKCGRLSSVTIPPSVTSIGVDAFYYCNKLRIVYVGKGEWVRVMRLYDWGYGVELVEIDPPVVEGDPSAIVVGDPANGFIIKPSEGRVVVEVTIPQGVDAAKVTVEVSPKVASVKPHGATVRIVNGGADITEFLNVPTADGNGVVDLTKATVKEEIVKEVLDVEKGAKIVLDAVNPSLTTPNTRVGLFYQLREGATLDGMKDGDSTIGDGQPWSPEITVKGGNSAFYSIGVGKGD